jgi:ELMO domain-containing protein
LSEERDVLFAIAKVKLDIQLAEHEIIIKTIYRSLTESPSCRSIGSHWVDVGFQGNDPSTDVRGAGMLGVLHLLYFVTEYPKTAREILAYS